MGLFSKKTCALCGGKVGLLGYKIADGQYMCSDCRLNCTPGLQGEQIRTMDPDAIRADMAVMERARDFYKTRFRASKRFCTGERRDKTVLLVDEQNDCWVNAAEREPYVLSLKDVLNYNIRLSTSKNDDDSSDLFDLFRSDYGEKYPEIPSCPWGETVVGMHFMVYLSENSLGVQEVDLDLFPGLFTNQNDLRAAYDCAHEIYQFFTDYQKSTRELKKAAEASMPRSSAEMLQTLEKLNELLYMGVLTQEEFDAKKKQILGL